MEIRDIADQDQVRSESEELDELNDDLSEEASVHEPETTTSQLETESLFEKINPAKFTPVDSLKDSFDDEFDSLSVGANETAVLQNQIEKYREINGMLQSKIELANKSKFANEKIAHKLDAELEDYKDKLTEMENALESENQSRAESQFQKLSSESELEEYRKKIIELESEVGLANKHSEHIDTQNQFATEEADKYRTKIFDLESALELESEENQKYQSLHQSSVNQLEEVNQKIVELESAIEEADEREQDYESINQISMEQLENYQGKLAELESEVEAAKEREYKSNFLHESDDQKPETLDAPQGNADDLTRIKGVGPVLQRKLNNIGFFHFWQIANLTEENIKWVDKFLDYPGRVERGNWLEQASKLMDQGK